MLDLLRFQYKEYDQGIFRPVIPLEIEYQGRSVIYQVLVDSGADVCIFHSFVEEVLGLDLTKGRKQYVMGLGGEPQSYYIHPVNIRVRGVTIPVEAGFLPSIGINQYGVVGQSGFFERFVVSFDRLKKSFQLQQRGL